MTILETMIQTSQDKASCEQTRQTHALLGADTGKNKI